MLAEIHPHSSQLTGPPLPSCSQAKPSRSRSSSFSFSVNFPLYLCSLGFLTRVMGPAWGGGWTVGTFKDCLRIQTCYSQLRPVIEEIFGNNRFRSSCLQVQSVKCWHPLVFLYSIGVYAINSSKPSSKEVSVLESSNCRLFFFLLVVTLLAMVSQFYKILQQMHKKREEK